MTGVTHGDTATRSVAAAPPRPCSSPTLPALAPLLRVCSPGWNIQPRDIAQRGHFLAHPACPPPLGSPDASRTRDVSPEMRPCGRRSEQFLRGLNVCRTRSLTHGDSQPQLGPSASGDGVPEAGGSVLLPE